MLITVKEIKELAGHRAVPPWIVKLVNDACAIAVARALKTDKPL